MRHSFNSEIARDIGINNAIIFDYLFYWVDENCKSGKNFHDDKYWTYNSVQKLTEKFIYLTHRQISNSLDKLEELGYIETSNYNDKKYDRTKWYTITITGFEYYIKMTNAYYENAYHAMFKNVKSIMQKCEMDYAEMSNGLCENVKPIPINKHSFNINKEESRDHNQTSGFDYSQYKPEIQEKIKEFVQFRKDIKKPFKTQSQLDAWYKQLGKLSNKNAKDAIEIIDNSIINGWQGIFELKNKKHLSHTESLPKL